MRSLEQTLSAVLLASAREQPPVPGAWRAEMERMAERSRERYRGARLRRPGLRALLRAGDAARRADRRSTSARARPSARRAGSRRCARSRGSSRGRRTGCCCRRGTARAPRSRRAPLELQREMAADWPFFGSLLSTLEMALYKTDLGVAERYLGLVEPELRDRFWPGIAHEHDQVVGRLLEITGAPSLLDDSPALQRRLSHPQPVDRPALAPAGRAARPRARRAGRRARAAAGHDHRDRRRACATRADAQPLRDAQRVAFPTGTLQRLSRG